MAVIEFLAGHPGEGFGLSELSRELGVNKATLLSVVTTLLDDGWLLQHPIRRSYSLGPTLIGAGAAALERFPDTAPLQPHMEWFATRFGVGCVAVAVVDGQIVILARAGFGDPLHGLTRAGARMRFAPPFGLALAAWYPPKEFDDWLGVATPPLDPTETSQLHAAVRVARDRGYVVGVDLPPGHELERQLWTQRLDATGISTKLLTTLGQALRRHGYYLDDIDAATSYRANHLSAPVLVGDAAPEVALMVPLYEGPQTGARLVELGEGLIAATRRVADGTR